MPPPLNTSAIGPLVMNASASAAQKPQIQPRPPRSWRHQHHHASHSSEASSVSVVRIELATSHPTEVARTPAAIRPRRRPPSEAPKAYDTATATAADSDDGRRRATSEPPNSAWAAAPSQ